MADPTNAGLHGARPTINLNGEDQAALAEGLLRLEICETIEGLYRCEAAFGNWGDKNGKSGFLYFDRDLLEFGKAFKVKTGTDVLFDGRIMALESSFPEGSPPDLTVLAEDRFQDLRMTRRTRTFNDMSDSDVVNQVAGDHGLRADARITGPTHKVLAQVNLSDLAFLRERARSVDAELWAEGDTLHVHSRTNRRGTAIELTHGHELRSFCAVADLASQRSSVTANGWDVAGKTAIQHEATDSVISGELNGDSSGVSILRSALGERKEAVAHTVPLDSPEAQHEAESWFKKCARQFVVGRGIAETQAKLRVGAVLDLKNIGPLFSGKYYVVESRHRFDSKKGLRTEFAVERAGLGRGR